MDVTPEKFAVLRNPYKDSLHVSLTATATFAPSDFDGDVPKTVTAHGRARAKHSFKPVKEIATVDVKVTYGGEDVPDKTLCHAFTKGADIGSIEMVAARFGERNAFQITTEPEAADHEDCCAACHTGRTGAALTLAAMATDSLGCGISWPTLEAGRDLAMGFVIGRGLLDRIALVRDLPSSCEEAPKSVTIEIHVTMMGPALR